MKIWKNMKNWLALAKMYVCMYVYTYVHTFVFPPLKNMVKPVAMIHVATHEPFKKVIPVPVILIRRVSSGVMEERYSCVLGVSHHIDIFSRRIGRVSSRHHKIGAVAFEDARRRKSLHQKWRQVQHSNIRWKHIPHYYICPTCSKLNHAGKPTWKAYIVQVTNMLFTCVERWNGREMKIERTIKYFRFIHFVIVN